MTTSEKRLWDKTAALLGNSQVSFDGHWSFNFRNDPKRLGFVLSRYKFSAKMACQKGSVLELGCGFGIGAPILAERAEKYVGIDLDEPAVLAAQRTFPADKYEFVYDDFMGKEYGKFDAVISLDVAEHILPEFQAIYFDTIFKNMKEDGICVIGTPNITSSPYASECSKMGHVNMFSQERLVSVMKGYFHQVFPFGMNDEIAHTGYAPMAHYLMCVGCHKRESK